MAGYRQAVLLCAEDDDLDLVSLVHVGRQRGLALEVRPGVENDDGPLLSALDDTPRALLVLIRSENLSAERALAIKSTFTLARTDEQDLLAVMFDPERVEAALEMIATRLEQLGPDPSLPDVVISPDAATSRLTPLGMPIDPTADGDFDVDIDVSSSSSAPAAEFDVTIRQTLDLDAAPPSSDPTEPSDPYDDLEPPPSPRARGPLLVGVLAIAGLAAAGIFGVMAMGDDEAPAAEPAPAPAAVQVIEAPQPEPAPVEKWKSADAPPEVAPTPFAEAIEGEAEPTKKKRRRRRR